MGKQESPKSKERVLADGGFPDRVLGFMGWSLWTMPRKHRDSCVPLPETVKACVHAVRSSVRPSPSPSGSHMGNRSSYLQIDSVTCIILQAFPPELPAPVFNNLAIHVAEPLAPFFTMCLVVCVSGPCVTQWNGRWDRCQEPGEFALSQTRDLGKVIWLSSVSPPPLSFMWNTL